MFYLIEDTNTDGLIIQASRMGSSSKDKTSISESDFENVMLHKDISVINLPAVEEVIKAENKIKAWDEYRVGAAKRIWDSQYPVHFVVWLKEKYTEGPFIEFVKTDGFPVLKTNEEITEYMAKKLNRFKEIIDKYKQVIAQDTEKFGISKKEFVSLMKELNSGKYSNITSKLFAKLNADRLVWEREWGCDFEAFGGGKVFMNPDENLLHFRTPETLYNLSLSNDIIVYCHGTNITPAHHLSQVELDLAQKIELLMGEIGTGNAEKAIKEFDDKLTPEEKKILEKYKADKLVRYYQIQTGPLQRYFTIFPHIRTLSYYRDRIRGDLKKNWGFGSPLKTPYGTFRDINEFCRECIRQGNKRIKIFSCNPGHYYLADDIKRMEGVMVDYQMNSVFVESVDNRLSEANSFVNIQNSIIKRYPDAYQNKILKYVTDKYSSVVESMKSDLKKSDLQCAKIVNNDFVFYNKTMRMSVCEIDTVAYRKKRNMGTDEKSFRDLLNDKVFSDAYKHDWNIFNDICKKYNAKPAYKAMIGDINDDSWIGFTVEFQITSEDINNAVREK